MAQEWVLLGGERHTIRQCGTCGVWHTVPEIVYNSYRAEGGFWHCPNGHARGFRKGQDEIDRENTRIERDRLKQQNVRLEEEASEARVRAEKAEKATKRLKKRSSAGTCPCCSRTFSNMAEHMKHRHPEFVIDNGAQVIPIERHRS